MYVCMPLSFFPSFFLSIFHLSNYFLPIRLEYLHKHAPPRGLSTLVKELSAATRIMQSSSKELSTLVADRVLKCKQTDAAAIAT